MVNDNLKYLFESFPKLADIDAKYRGDFIKGKLSPAKAMLYVKGVNRSTVLYHCCFKKATASLYRSEQ